MRGGMRGGMRGYKMQDLVTLELEGLCNNMIFYLCRCIVVLSLEAVRMDS